MEKMDRKKLILMIEEMDKQFVVYNKAKEAIAISARLDDLKEFSKNQEVQIFRYDRTCNGDSWNTLNYKQTGVIFKSNTMKKTIELIEAVAPTDTTVLVQGETGTGKGILTKLIHMNSRRKDRPFIDINCAAIPEKLLESELFGYEAGSFTGALDTGKPGLFEMAGDGTVFLDEINSLPMSLQVKFLRVLQEKEVMRVGGTEYLPVHARIIVASNIDLLEAVEAGTFREDLYYRLNIVPITVAPLRNRKEDIRVLGEFFLDQCNKRYKQNKYISDEVWKELKQYQWPGNVRELENMIERLSVITVEDCIGKGDLTDLFSKIQTTGQFRSSIKMTLKEEMKAYEKRLIETRMGTCKTTAELAKTLGIDKSTLTRKLKRLDIKRNL